jgi:hypothetical protein
MMMRMVPSSYDMHVQNGRGKCRYMLTAYDGGRTRRIVVGRGALARQARCGADEGRKSQGRAWIARDGGRHLGIEARHASRALGRAFGRRIVSGQACEAGGRSVVEGRVYFGGWGALLLRLGERDGARCKECKARHGQRGDHAGTAMHVCLFLILLFLLPLLLLQKVGKSAGEPLRWHELEFSRIADSPRCICICMYICVCVCVCVYDRYRKCPRHVRATRRGALYCTWFDLFFNTNKFLRIQRDAVVEKPAGHRLHSCMPAPGVYDPGSHGWHVNQTLAPTVLEKVPAGHLRQSPTASLPVVSR